MFEALSLSILYSGPLQSMGILIFHWILDYQALSLVHDGSKESVYVTQKRSCAFTENHQPLI